MAKVGTVELARISARGVVQGVGFRPFVYQLATRHNLKGWVCNTSEDVRIEVQGEHKHLERFVMELRSQAPPLAHIEDVSVSYHPPADYRTFEIRRSVAEEGKYQLVSPDIAICPACLTEVLDPNDRRYRYPFTNCTNCGPRFTIIEDIPYDRPKTTMRCFQMCPQCQAEYDDPLNRRFHAQPNACSTCGPQLELVDTSGKHVACADAISEAVHLLREGKILAIKGLGGFLLACDATNEDAVQLLRRRKRRPFKPLAIMVASLDEAEEYCQVTESESKLLTLPQSPIVLLWRNPFSAVCQSVAPNLKYLGVMLPYTPLHHILLKEVEVPLVMTSGNISEEPIVKDNDEALRRLSDIADYFLVHKRDIYARYDDSVAFADGNDVQLVRRARGYAPYPVRLSFPARQVLGCGAGERNTFCLTRDTYAFISQHIGDMENLETLEHYQNTLDVYRKLFRIEPEIVAYDMHPEYLSTRYALELAAQSSFIKMVPVQHHHAHIVSCMADNGIDSPVIGVSLDGTGYGSDGNIWGGEFLVADCRDFKRVGHLEYLRLPGGDAATRRPYRIAVGYLLQLLGGDSIDPRLAFLREVDPVEIGLIQRQIQTGLNSPMTSSMGRLFDAISALLDIRGTIDYDGQAAIELEMLAYEDDRVGALSYPYSITESDGVNVIHIQGVIAAVVQDLHRGVSRPAIAAKFHNSVAAMILEMCRRVASSAGISVVALSGGVFQNRLLLRKVIPLLESAGLKVLTHQQVPCNDGGISLGQAVVGNFC